MRNRRFWRQPQIPLFIPVRGRIAQPTHPKPQRLPRFLERHPPGILQLGIIPQVDLLPRRRRLADGANHQVRGIGPGLSGMDDDATELDARLLPDLAPHRLLDRLGGLAEAGERGVPVRRPLVLPAEQDLGGVGGDDRHDDGGVGAREGQVRDALAGGAGRPVGGRGRGRGAADGGGEFRAGGILGGTGAFEAGVDGEGWGAALGAEGVAGVPVEELARFGVDGGWRWFSTSDRVKPVKPASCRLSVSE